MMPSEMDKEEFINLLKDVGANYGVEVREAEDGEEGGFYHTDKNGELRKIGAEHKTDDVIGQLKYLDDLLDNITSYSTTQ